MNHDNRVCESGKHLTSEAPASDGSSRLGRMLLSDRFRACFHAERDAVRSDRKTGSVPGLPSLGECYALTKGQVAKYGWPTVAPVDCTDSHNVQIVGVAKIPQKFARLGRASMAVKAFRDLTCQAERLSKGVATHPCDCPVEPARWATYTGCPTAETSDTVVSD